MALDRFIYFKKSPKLETIRETLEDYLGEALYEIPVDGARVTALLHGKPSCPFRRLPDMGNVAAAQEQREERFLEVCWTSTSIDVITRQSDEYTNVVGDGFAALAARFWKGKRNG